MYKAIIMNRFFIFLFCVMPLGTLVAQETKAELDKRIESYSAYMKKELKLTNSQYKKVLKLNRQLTYELKALKNDQKEEQKKVEEAYLEDLREVLTARQMEEHLRFMEKRRKGTRELPIETTKD